MSPLDQRLLFAIVEHLHSLKSEEGSDADNLDVACDTLSSAFSLDLENVKQVEDLSYRPHTLSQIFEAGVKALKAKTVGQDMVELEGNTYFKQYMDKITEKGFFRGVEQGTKAYLDRYLKAVSKFKEKLMEGASKGGETPGVSKPAAPKRVSTAADLERAEQLKLEGNKAIAGKDFSRAIDLYSQAIELAPEGPNSHIYFCNRAAARSHMGAHEEAVADSEKAVELNPNYSKAYSRLGYANFYLENYEAAVVNYKRAIELEPNLATNREYLEKAQAKVRAGLGNRSGAGLSGGAGGDEDMPGLEHITDLLKQPGGLQTIMQNPQLLSMAQNLYQNDKVQNMMKNPAIIQMAQQMMQNPNMMHEMMGALGGGGLGGLGGMGSPMAGAGGEGGGMGPGGMPNLANLMAGLGGGMGAGMGNNPGDQGEEDEESSSDHMST